MNFLSDKKLVENHTIFFAYFCHLIDQHLIDFPEEWCEIGAKLDDEILRRKISNADIFRFIKNANLDPQDQLMVSTYIYPESGFFKLIRV